MNRRKIAGILCMALGFTVIGNSNVNAALITDGTHNVSGNYNAISTAVVSSLGIVTLNATGDVVMSTMYPTLVDTGESTIIVRNPIDINMNNHNLNLTGNLSLIRSALTSPNVDLKINQVNNLNFTIVGRETAQGQNIIQSDIANSSFYFDVKNDLTVNNKFDLSIGDVVSISAVNQDKMVFEVGNNASLDTSGVTIFSFDQSKLQFDIGNNMEIISGSTALIAENQGEIEITAGNNFVAKTGASAIISLGSSQIDIIAKKINIDSKGSGLYVNTGSVVNLTAENSIAIESSGSTILNGLGGGIGNIKAKNDITLKATDPNIVTVGVNANGAGAVFNIESEQGNINVDATGRGLRAVNGARINALSDIYVKAGATGSEVRNGGIVNVENGLEIVADIAIDIAGANSKFIATNASKRKAITGDIISNGPNTAMVDVKFGTADSFFKGKTERNAFGYIKLDFANNSVWNMTGDSELTDLINRATVDMTYPGPGTYKTLTTATLDGGGVFKMNTDLQKSFDNKDVLTDSDKIVITEGSAGKHYIEIKDKSLIGGNSAEGYLLLVEDQGDKQATFEGKATSTGGVWKYMPIITDVDPDPSEFSNAPVGSRNWYLKAFEATEISENTETSISLSDTRYDNYFREDDTLLKRLGELRFVKDQPETDGIWVRYRRGGTITDRFDGTFTTMQVGYDKKTSDKRYTGLAISHTTNKHDFAEATGEGSQTALLLYNTWLGDKEHYFDIVGKVGKMRGESNFYDRNNFAYNENGDYRTWYYGASFEYGRKNRSESGWYYEPQAQLTLGRINGTDYTTSLGTAVRQDAVNTILLRTGVTVGKEFNLDNPQKRANIYGKINWLYDFKGDVNTSLRDAAGDTYSETNAYGGSSWNAGVGATVNLNRATHFYFDVEKNFGGKVRSNWMAQAGLRWAFGGPKG